MNSLILNSKGDDPNYNHVKIIAMDVTVPQKDPLNRGVSTF